MSLLLLAIVAAVGITMWAGGALAILCAGGHPQGAITAGLSAMMNFAHPAAAWPTATATPGPLRYWSITGAILSAAVIAAAIGTRKMIGRAGSGRHRPRDVGRMARRRDLQATAGKRSLIERRDVLRPSLATCSDPRQLGYRIGRAQGVELWFAVEDSVLLLGPPRSGKGTHCVIPWILDAPGPVVATSTRPDNLAITIRTRAEIGPVAVFDPQRLAANVGGLRWSPVRGCERPATAMARARALGAGAGWSGRGAGNGAFWAGQTEAVLRCLLHAAALDGRGAADLYRWSQSAAACHEPATILDSARDAAPGWADALTALVDGEPTSRDSIWLGVRQSLSGLADPDVLAALSPEAHTSFDPATFLRQSGTLYLLASSTAAASCASLIACLVEDITETARAVAARSANGRLDPPLFLALDEVANLTPLPSLPSLMAEGGGRGITTLAVLQSLAQARERWGEHATDAIWDAATVKLVLGGVGRLRDLQDLSQIIGDHDELVTSRSHTPGQAPSTSTSTRQTPTMPPDALRTLPHGSAIVIWRSTKPAVIDLSAWQKRNDSDQLRQDQRAFEASTGPGARGR